MSKTSDILIVIPARYHSTRFPGKPLAKIAGKTMLQRVWEISQAVCKNQATIDSVVTTEDSRIVDYCQTLKIPVVQTSKQCDSGTERVYETVQQLQHNAEMIINLQGDNVLCPPWFLEALINDFLSAPTLKVFTPFVKLTWLELDVLREQKKVTPFSGTTVVYKNDYSALWFSKNIIPAIRKEEDLRHSSIMSPVARHIGLYGYHRDVLKRTLALKSSGYESLEGLEQLKFLENDIPIKMIEVDYRDRAGMSGVDSPEDIQRAEQIIDQYGELT